MKRIATQIKDIKDIGKISANLTAENKKYVVAVANALLFSQSATIQPKTSEKAPA